MCRIKIRLILLLLVYLECVILTAISIRKDEVQVHSMEHIEIVEEVVEHEPEIISEVVSEPINEPIVELVSLGEFTLTAYCVENYHHICNNGDATVTATGTTPTEGRTIAVDPSVIPYGTEVVINGNTYIAEDTGGAIKGNRIDICFASHDEALQFGKQTAEVFIIGGGVNK